MKKYLDNSTILCGLKKVRDNVIVKQNKPKSIEGICLLTAIVLWDTGLTFQCEQLYPRLAELFKGWVYHSGNSKWPVPERPAADWDKVHNWEGQQLMYRLDLLCYAINKLEKKVQNER